MCVWKFELMRLVSGLIGPHGRSKDGDMSIRATSGLKAVVCAAADGSFAAPL